MFARTSPLSECKPSRCSSSFFVFFLFSDDKFFEKIFIHYLKDDPNVYHPCCCCTVQCRRRKVYTRSQPAGQLPWHAWVGLPFFWRVVPTAQHKELQNCIILFLLINTVTPFSLTACIFFQPPWDVMEIRVGRFNQPFINQDIF